MNRKRANVVKTTEPAERAKDLKTTKVEERVNKPKPKHHDQRTINRSRLLDVRRPVPTVRYAAVIALSNPSIVHVGQPGGQSS